MPTPPATPDLPHAGHDPVLIAEVLELLAPGPGKIVVDCTLGRAGHASVIAQRLGPTGRLIGLDVDPHNLEFAKSRLADAPCEVRLFHANFAELPDVLRELKLPGVDAVLADLGISTNQLFDSRYGMSFSLDMPLDMRIDPRIDRSAADIVNDTREDVLADVLYELAQERYSRRIARKIADARRVSPINTTGRLAALVRAAIGHTTEKIDPATRTFLALRMAVNRELENLAALLELAPPLLNPGGRLAVISFQSMEDRLVKQAFRALDQTGSFEALTKRPIEPSDAEIAANPRSRSSKMRIVKKAVLSPKS